MTVTRTFPGRLFLFLAVLLLVPAVTTAQPAQAPLAADTGEDKEDCNCYWDSDCGDTTPDCTGYNKCKLQGKLDGTCQGRDAVPVDPGTTTDALSVDVGPAAGPNPAAVAHAVELYVKAYLSPTVEGTGRGDIELIREAQQVDLGRRHAARHLKIQEAVHEALDATLGFDFLMPFPHGDLFGGAVYGYDSAHFGNVRIVPPAAPELVEAVRTGLVEAVRTGDAAAVAAPLGDFWQRNPDYEPFHTGRYYPHGHEHESQEVVHIQTAALERIAERLIDLR